MAVTETIPLAQLPAWGERLARDVLAKPWTRTLKSCGVLIAADAKENFAGGHDPEGKPWERLKRSRPSGRGNDQPLKDKGLLAASMSSRGRGFFQQITDYRLEQGTNLEYAALHQFGGVVSAKRAQYLTIPLTTVRPCHVAPLRLAGRRSLRGADGGGA